MNWQPSLPGLGPSGSIPRGPQPEAEQLTLPFPSRTPPKPGFLGRYVNRNANGLQFNKPEIKKAVQTGVEGAMRSQYFRRAGFGAAMRYTLGMEQMPSHVQDYLNARTHGQRQTGNHPGPLYAEAQEPEA